jgi:hypothetical protein
MKHINPPLFYYVCTRKQQLTIPKVYGHCVGWRDSNTSIVRNA